MVSTFNHLVGMIILVLSVWSVVHVLGSDSPAGMRMLWVLPILLLPGLGLILWATAGPRWQPARPQGTPKEAANRA